MEFDELFCLRKLRHLLCLVFIHSYQVQFVNKSFEIMDTILINMHFLRLT